MIEEARRSLASRRAPWDQVRERRVLGRIETEIARRADRATKVRRGGAVMAIAAAVVLVIGGIAGAVGESSPSTAASASTPDTSAPVALAETRQPPEPSTPDEVAPTMALPDGSLATLHDAAQVSVDVQTEALVRLVQHTGTVRYEVSKDPRRRFVVDAAGIEVRVIGTIFTVGIEEPRVRVAVERGRVEVEGPNGVSALGAGDELRVPTPEEDLVVLLDDPEPSTPAATRPSKPDKASGPAQAVASIDTLLARADTARAAGELAGAADALHELVRTHRRDPRAYSSYFQLGKIERARGRHAAAAAAFAGCHRHSPAGSLSEDARAEAAVSWLDAGKPGRARRAAEAYLQRHPEGAHVARMRRILDRTR